MQNCHNKIDVSRFRTLKKAEPSLNFDRSPACWLVAAALATIAAVAAAVVAARGRGWFRRHGHGSHKGKTAPAATIEAAVLRVWYVHDNHSDAARKGVRDR